MWLAWREIKRELGGEYPPQGDLNEERNSLVRGFNWVGWGCRIKKGKQRGRSALWNFVENWETLESNCNVGESSLSGHYDLSVYTMKTIGRWSWCLESFLIEIGFTCTTRVAPRSRWIGPDNCSTCKTATPGKVLSSNTVGPCMLVMWLAGTDSRLSGAQVAASASNICIGRFCVTILVQNVEETMMIGRGNAEKAARSIWGHLRDCMGFLAEIKMMTDA
jgi:hypothetical protein